MPAGAITIRLKKGQSPPPGYSLLHSLRRTNIYKKNISAPGPVQAIQEAVSKEMDALTEIFSGLSASDKPVVRPLVANSANALTSAFAALAVEGGARTRRRRTSRRRRTILR